MNEEQKKKAITALETGDVETIKTLADENKEWLTLPLHDGLYPIHIATMHKQEKAVLLLLEMEPEQINQRDYCNQTALIFAAANGCTEIVQRLVSLSADLHYITKGFNHEVYGWTALQWAREKGHADCEKILQEAFRQAAEKAISENPKLLTDDTDASLLHESTRLCHIEAVKYLIAEGANKHVRYGFKKLSLLHIAAQHGYLTLVEFLLTDTPEYLEQTDHIGQTALHLAAAAGHLEVVAHLVVAGANLFAEISIGIDKGKLPINLAIRNQHHDTVYVLIVAMSEQQSIENLLHYVQDAQVAIKLMGRNTSFVPLLRNDERINDLIHASTYCETTARKFYLYHKGTPRTISFYGKIDKLTGKSNFFAPVTPALGEGTSGLVRLFASNKNGKTTAVKLNKRPCAPERIKQELDLMRLAYPEPNAYHLFFTPDEAQYRFIMPYRKGETLHHWTRKEMSCYKLAKICYLVAAELHRLHEIQIIHGDAISQNIVVSTKEDHYVIYFVDFGSAYSARGKMTKLSPKEGEKRYPPERRTEHPETRANPKQDVFTLAATFEFILSRHPGYAELCASFPSIPAFITQGSMVIPRDRPWLGQFCDTLNKELMAADAEMSNSAESSQCTQ